MAYQKEHTLIMVRIIKKNDVKERAVVHSLCGTEIGYHPIDIGKYTYTEANGQCMQYNGIECPNCKREILLTNDGKEYVRN